MRAACATLIVGLAFVAAACGQAEAPAAKQDVAYLSPTEHLLRASMALRGIRPALDELEAVADDPSVLPAIVDYYLDSPEFGETIREMHAEQLQTHIDAVIYPAGFPAIGALEGTDVQEINQSVTDAPARYVEHVVMNDRPYHEIVTGEYTVVDPIVATVFGVPYDESGDRWQEARYTDGRPVAGILSDSWLFTRHSSTVSNRNRGRAAFVARSLLCYDFLSREVEVDTAGIDLADDEALAQAIRENDACASCHQTLDPLAAHFADYFPLYVPQNLTAYPVEIYGNPLAQTMRVTEPGFFGEPSGGIRDLGVLIAEDPRFTTCAARRFYSYIVQVPENEVPFEAISDLNDVFVNSGQNAKALARAIVLSDDFRVSHAIGEDDDDEDEGDDEGEDVHGMMKVRPEQLARTVEDLTGFRWQTRLRYDFGAGEVGRVDLMTDSLFGFSVLAGGTDGQAVTQPSHTMSATSTLVLRALAAQAAPYAVNADFAETDASRRWLLRRVEPDTREQSAIRAQLVDLELRFFGQVLAPDSPEIDDVWTLFSSALASSSDVRHAWVTTLYALLQDVRLAYF